LALLMTRRAISPRLATKIFLIIFAMLQRYERKNNGIKKPPFGGSFMGYFT